MDQTNLDRTVLIGFALLAVLMIAGWLSHSLDFHYGFAALGCSLALGGIIARKTRRSKH